MLSGKRQKFTSMEKTIGKELSFLSAHSWTALSLVFGFAAALFISQNQFIAGAVLVLIAAVCDAVDGAVARYSKTASKGGAYLDTIADRYVEFFIIAGLFFAALPDFLLSIKFWLLFYIFGAMMTTYAKAAAKEKGLIQKEMHYGILERGERLSLLFLGILLAALNARYLAYMIALTAVLGNITALQRIRKAFQG